MEASYKIYKIRCSYRYFINYTYIVSNLITKECFIIDPSWELDKIISILQYENLNLKAILLTHSHIDHTNLVKPLTDMLKIKVYISKAEAEETGFSVNNLILVGHLEKIHIAAADVICILTPGHTIGSMCFYLNGHLFTGDTLFYEGCGLCRDRARAGNMFESIQYLKTNIPENTKIYPGHCYGMPPGQFLYNLINNNIYFWIHDKNKFIDFLLNLDNKKIFDFK